MIGLDITVALIIQGHRWASNSHESTKRMGASVYGIHVNWLPLYESVSLCLFLNLDIGRLEALLGGTWRCPTREVSSLPGHSHCRCSHRAFRSIIAPPQRLTIPHLRW